MEDQFYLSGHKVGAYSNTPVQGPVASGEGGFDAIISAFSLHFLTEDEKKALFSKCYEALKPGGIFIDAEAVISPSAKVYQLYMEKWKEFQRSNGFSEDEIGAHMLKFVRDVKPLTVERQLGLMNDAGFADAECYFKYLNLAVFGDIRICRGEWHTPISYIDSETVMD